MLVQYHVRQKAANALTRQRKDDHPKAKAMVCNSTVGRRSTGYLASVNTKEDGRRCSVTIALWATVRACVEPHEICILGFSRRSRLVRCSRKQVQSRPTRHTGSWRVYTEASIRKSSPATVAHTDYGRNDVRRVPPATWIMIQKT